MVFLQKKTFTFSVIHTLYQFHSDQEQIIKAFLRSGFWVNKKSRWHRYRNTLRHFRLGIKMVNRQIASNLSSLLQVNLVHRRKTKQRNGQWIWIAQKAINNTPCRLQLQSVVQREISLLWPSLRKIMIPVHYCLTFMLAKSCGDNESIHCTMVKRGSIFFL